MRNIFADGCIKLGYGVQITNPVCCHGTFVVHLLYDDETGEIDRSGASRSSECLLMAHSLLVDREMNVFHCVAGIPGSSRLSFLFLRKEIKTRMIKCSIILAI